MVFRDSLNGGDAGFKAGCSMKEAGKFVKDKKIQASRIDYRASLPVSPTTNKRSYKDLS